MEQVSYGSPHMYDMIFFRPASKESTACPNDKGLGNYRNGT